ncbi:MAG TPA: hypothetical protein VL137_08425, partial [Polyangiaceae bacterium]|nr:hypothetical protein [Polyangiaceae bacterium]
RGTMPELSGVRGKPDGQWVAVSPVITREGTKGLYVTGWSWAAYAYRLEFALRGSVRHQITEAKSNDKEPLLYVFVQAADQVYGAPASPQINADAIAGRKLMNQLKPKQTYAEEIEITERPFGLAARQVPALGDQVAIVVLRSET